MLDTNALMNIYGKDFEINPRWKYHSTIYIDNMISIIKHGLLTKFTLIRTGYNKSNSFNYVGQNGLYRVSLAERKRRYFKNSAYELFIKNNPAIIINEHMPVERYRIAYTTGIKSLFIKKELKSITSYPDEVLVFGDITPNNIVGMKLGNDDYINYNLINTLNNENINIKLYDFNSLKCVDSKELINVL